jgi:endoglucanase
VFDAIVTLTCLPVFLWFSSSRIILIAPNAQGNQGQINAVYPETRNLPGSNDQFLAVTLHTYDPWDFCGQTGRNSYFSSLDAMRNNLNQMMSNVESWYQRLICAPSSSTIRLDTTRHDTSCFMSCLCLVLIFSSSLFGLSSPSLSLSLSRSYIPTHFGEYGVGRQNSQAERNTDLVREYYRYLTNASIANGWPTSVWDDRGYLPPLSPSFPPCLPFLIATILF